MNKAIKRMLAFDLPEGKSAFLWGPRKTGKTTYLKARFPNSLYFDFLKTDLFFEFSKRPFLLREQLLAKKDSLITGPIILDEVQKVPQVLDEVHWLMENRGLCFILCGSSARKLKRGRANLLGGRAWRYEMFPLVSAELQEINLLRVLNRGMIPSHYFDDGYRQTLKAYVQDYLKEEVFDEGLTRNIPAFSRFFDVLGFSHGELTNYSNIARDCGVDAKTVKQYFQILADTLLGTMVEPFTGRRGRQIISSTPKFYLFDAGVAGIITNSEITIDKGDQFGKAFEHFIFTELAAHRSYSRGDYVINFWRTKSGLEVDFVLGKGAVALEVKGSDRIENRDLKGLKAFMEEHAPREAIVVCTERQERIHEGIRIMPWSIFLQRLWEGNIL